VLHSSCDAFLSLCTFGVLEEVVLFFLMLILQVLWLMLVSQDRCSIQYSDLFATVCLRITISHTYVVVKEMGLLW